MSTAPDDSAVASPAPSARPDGATAADTRGAPSGVVPGGDPTHPAPLHRDPAHPDDTRPGPANPDAANPDDANRDTADRAVTNPAGTDAGDTPGLRFGTAGLRGPLGDGPDAMNERVVIRTTAGLAAWLAERGAGGGRVVVGRDARHGSASFLAATTEVLAAAGFEVVAMPGPLPTPVTAFTVRAENAVAGVQITASHNPATDNGYKVYLADGAQLAAPADREIEQAIARVGDAADIPRAPVAPGGPHLLDDYLERVSTLARSPHRTLRIAVTPLHGVGGETVLAALSRAGFTDLHVVPEQFEPDPEFPTVAFPNPEEPGACDLLIATAVRVDADLAIALDPDADRCRVGVPVRDGSAPGTWRMFRGDETGVLLADRILATTTEADPLIATTVVSSEMAGALAAARGARYARTPTGFKWLARAGDGLVYAYEEAIGHCVDPEAVRDKDGIATAVVVADLAADLAAHGRTLLDAWSDLEREFGIHRGDQVSLRLPDPDAIAAVLDGIRRDPPHTVAGEPVTVVDLADVGVRVGAGPSGAHTVPVDAVELRGPTLRVVVRPSGTEPKLKCYLEVVGRDGDLARVERTLSALRTWARDLGGSRSEV